VDKDLWCFRQTLEAELKLIRDDCHRVTLELQERRLRVSRLEAKFGVLSTRSKSLYEEEEPKSQAYYVIKNAQEREELQKRGDTLDAENQRLEHEVGCTVTTASAGQTTSTTIAAMYLVPCGL
jgi:coiled-coil domain-containing protein 39